MVVVWSWGSFIFSSIRYNEYISREHFSYWKKLISFQGWWRIMMGKDLSSIRIYTNSTSTHHNSWRMPPFSFLFPHKIVTHFRLYTFIFKNTRIHSCLHIWIAKLLFNAAKIQQQQKKKTTTTKKNKRAKIYHDFVTRNLNRRMKKSTGKQVKITVKMPYYGEITTTQENNGKFPVSCF